MLSKKKEERIFFFFSIKIKLIMELAPSIDGRLDCTTQVRTLTSLDFGAHPKSHPKRSTNIFHMSHPKSDNKSLSK